MLFFIVSFCFNKEYNEWRKLGDESSVQQEDQEDGFPTFSVAPGDQQTRHCSSITQVVHP
jgi:hypothetical protein